jgi:hypothetical protein
MLIPGLNIEALPGIFLLVFNHECDSRVQVCQVVEATASSNLSVYWWFDSTILGTIVQLDTRQPLISSQYFNLVSSFLKKVTKTAVVKDLNLSCIVDIAFVFHAYDFQNTWVNCSGMSSVFFTRYELDIHGCLHEVEYSMHAPFSGNQVDGYSSHIWHSVMYLKEKMTSIMGKQTQLQLCQNSASIFFTLESWVYICQQLDAAAPLVHFTKCHSKPLTFSDLSIETFSTTAKLVMIRIATPAAMERAREVFGLTFGVGCRNGAPLKGHARRVLLQGDSVNVINTHSAENSIVQRRFKEFISAKSIDFVYEPLKRLLSVQAKYSHVMAESAVVATILKLCTFRVPNPTATRKRPINVGTNFLFQVNLVVVVKCDGTHTTVRIINDVQDISLLTFNARELLRQYTGL